MIDPKPAEEVETLPCAPAPADNGTPHGDDSTFSDGSGYA